MWWYLIIISILAIVIITCYAIRSNTVRTISNNDRALRELELMSDVQREQYFKERNEISTRKPPSPYGIERSMSRSGKWGWVLTRNGEKINNNGTYEVWFELHNVRQLQREMEKNDGCEITIF